MVLLDLVIDSPLDIGSHGCSYSYTSTVMVVDPDIVIHSTVQVRSGYSYTSTQKCITII